MNKVKETVMTMVLATRYSFSFCWRNKKWLTVARIVFSILTIVVFYAVVQVTGDLIDSVQISKNNFVGKTDLFEEFLNSNMIRPLVFIFLVSIFGVLIAEGDRYFKGVWRHSLQYSNQIEMNNHRATFDVARFRSKEHDDLSKRIQELPNSWQTRIWFSEAMFGLFSTIISFFMFGMSLLWYQPLYVLILVLSAIPMTFAEFNIVSKWWTLFQDLVPENKKRHVLERPYNERNAFLQAIMFNQMPTLREQVKSSLDGVLSSCDGLRKLTLHKSVTTRLIAVFGLFVVIVHTMWLISTKGGDIGTLTIVFAAARTFQGNLSSMVSTIADQWNSAKGVILIEKEFFGLKPLIETEYPVVPRFDIVPSLRFSNVSFSYPDQEELVLKNVNFEIKPGSKVAIVGKSGNGKSTILSLLMRHYDPTSGGVYAGDVNLKNIEPKTWNNIASALTQEYSVLSRRICDEISSSKPGYVMDLDKIIKSSQFANFDVVVDSDPDGYQSQIGTEFGGREFSGGERQRLALARVHYRGTPILILDEPDAKLDPESAEQVMNQVFALKGITVIIITHHVSRAERCDDIIVMGKGEVAEQGTHHELMSKNGTYAHMHKIDRERLGSLSEDL